MAVIYIIGGGNISKKETLSIDLDIIKSSGLSQPKVLYVPTAINDKEANIDSFSQYYRQLGAEVDVLKLINCQITQAEIRKKIAENDIIYFSGGQIERLMKYARKFSFDVLLRETFLTKKIIVGISAGACQFFTQCFGDLNAYQYRGDFYGYRFTSGLGIFFSAFCPHYQSDGIMVFNDEIKTVNKMGIALEDGTALRIEKDTFTVIKSKGRQAFYLSETDNYQLVPFHEDVVYLNKQFIGGF